MRILLSLILTLSFYTYAEQHHATYFNYVGSGFILFNDGEFAETKTHLELNIEECKEKNFGEDVVYYRNKGTLDKEVSLYIMCTKGELLSHTRYNYVTGCSLSETFEYTGKNTILYKKIRSGCKGNFKNLNLVGTFTLYRVN